MFGLSVTVTAAILTSLLSAIGLAYLLFGWLRKRSWRVMFRGAGFVLIPLGLMSMGIMKMLVDGVNAVIDWAKVTVMNNWIMLGLIVGGIGLAAYLVGSFWPPIIGGEAESRRQAINDRKLAALQAGATPAGTPRPSAPIGNPPTPTPARTAAPASPAVPGPTTAVKPAPASTPMTPDDKEVDDILRRHGIE